MTDLQINRDFYGKTTARFTYHGISMLVESAPRGYYFKRVDYDLDKDRPEGKRIVADALFTYTYNDTIQREWTCDAFKVSDDCLDAIKSLAPIIVSKMRLKVTTD